jgi:uncharacterized HAD superfamily protein
MKIAIDIDDVLLQFVPTMIKYLNATYKTNLTVEEFVSYHFWEVWGGTREEAIQKVNDFHNTSYFDQIPPVTGALEAVQQLKKNNELFIITSRPYYMIPKTQKCIDHYFPNSFKEIHFTNQYSAEGSHVTKGDICNKLNIEVLIEDSLQFALDSCVPGRKVLLMNRPWNASPELPEGIIRINSWEDALAQISTYQNNPENIITKITPQIPISIYKTK